MRKSLVLVLVLATFILAGAAAAVGSWRVLGAALVCLGAALLLSSER